MLKHIGFDLHVLEHNIPAKDLYDSEEIETYPDTEVLLVEALEVHA